MAAGECWPFALVSQPRKRAATGIAVVGNKIDDAVLTGSEMRPILISNI
jgi:hypothetical protein